MTKTAVAPVNRLLSLDILRGITLAFMIMVNNNGGIGNGSGGTTSWWFMNHAEWIGLTPTDLVFPTFLFVIGVSVVFAFEARLAKGATRKELVKHTLSRTVILILFGIIVNNFPFFGYVHGHLVLPLEHIRYFGVLQRLGVGYCFVALFYLWDKRVSTKLIATAACLLAYWGILALVPTPGHGVQFLNPDYNIVNWVDQQLMPGHLYEDWTTHNLRDPEGFLSTLPSLATALLGLITGIFLRTNRTIKQKAAGLAIGAIACLVSGYVWSIWFPGFTALILFQGGSPRFLAIIAAWTACGAGAILFLILKKLTGRKRPSALVPHCWATLLPPDQFSFPSGHTITAFAFTAAVGSVYPHLMGALLFCALSVATSRIVLGMHFLSDVVVGAFLGAGLGYAGFLIFA